MHAAYDEVSLWFQALPGPVTPRPALDADTEADVAIVGAGFTGLWTAYNLRRLDPGLRVVVVERQVAGFGASGRNGGWCSALFATGWPALARRYGAGPTRALRAELSATVDAVGEFCRAEGLDFAKGGTLSVARTCAEAERLREQTAEAVGWGVDVRWLDRDAALERIRATRVHGAAYTPECATIQPAALVRGLAEAATRRGVRIYEQTPATSIRPGRVTTATGRVRARTVIRATEAYTAGLPGYRRTLAPVYSLLIATEPLPDPVWSELGWRDRETFTDGRHLLIYAQRSADDRIVFGGRGAPYHFGSRIRPGFDQEPGVFTALRAALIDLFPVVREAAITHRWGGPLGVPRDWIPSVGLDRSTGLGWAGGYVGDGVACSALAGRTLAELITGADTPRTRLPWVGHRSPRWAPEPLRWLQMNGGTYVMASADRIERHTAGTTRRARWFARYTGG
jgi:glycine/D-amino acid oxidase-like deaminating enzyme